jgi:hypothetical protein
LGGRILVHDVQCINRLAVPNPEVFRLPGGFLKNIGVVGAIESVLV